MTESDVYILWWRQMKRYLRPRSRVIGAVGQPLLFLLALGYGVGSVYKRAGEGDYLQFLVPGIIMQTIGHASRDSKRHIPIAGYTDLCGKAGL